MSPVVEKQNFIADAIRDRFCHHCRPVALKVTLTSTLQANIQNAQLNLLVFIPVAASVSYLLFDRRKRIVKLAEFNG